MMAQRELACRARSDRRRGKAGLENAPLLVGRGERYEGRMRPPLEGAGAGDADPLCRQAVAGAEIKLGGWNVPCPRIKQA